MIRFLHRWYHRIVHNVDPARDEADRAYEIMARRERAILYELAVRNMQSEDPKKRKLGWELHSFLQAADMYRLSRIFNKARRL